MIGLAASKVTEVLAPPRKVPDVEQRPKAKSDVCTLEVSTTGKSLALIIVFPLLCSLTMLTFMLLQAKGYLLALHLFQYQDRGREQVMLCRIINIYLTFRLLALSCLAGSRTRRLYEEIIDVKVDLSLQSISVDLTTVKGPLFMAEATGM